MKRIILLSLMLLVFGLVLPASAQGDPTVADIVASGAAQPTPEYTVLAAALAAADPAIAATLADPTCNCTVFLPTNAAFTQLLTDMGVTQDQLLANTTLLNDVLRYHVLPGLFDAAALTALAPANGVLPTVQGTPVAFSLDGSTLRVNNAAVITANVTASNGIVHVIDRVLVPAAPGTTPTAVPTDGATAVPTDGATAVPTDGATAVPTTDGTVTAVPTVDSTTTAVPTVDGTTTAVPTDGTPTVTVTVTAGPTTVPNNTIADTVASSAAGTPAEFTVLQAALLAADPAILTTLSDPTAQLTVFAPTDAAFAQLLTNLGVTQDQLLANTTLLNDVLRYHVVPAAFSSTALTDMAATNMTLPTLQGAGVGLSLLNGVLQINSSNVTLGDIAAVNGVIHVIDRVLLPTEAPGTGTVTPSPSPTVDGTVTAVPTVDGTPTPIPTDDVTLTPTATVTASPTAIPTLPPVDLPFVGALQNAGDVIVVAFTDANGEATLIVTTDSGLRGVLRALRLAPSGEGTSLDVLVCGVTVNDGTPSTEPLSPEVQQLQALAAAITTQSVDLGFDCEALVLR